MAWVLDLGTLKGGAIRRDRRYCATVSRGESFFALAANEVRALEVSVDGEKIEVYAAMSAVVTLKVSQHCFLSTYWVLTYVELLPMRLILIF